ncbi:MAG: replication initiation protein [Cetobacterium sp.]
MRCDDKLVDIGKELSRCTNNLTANEEKMIMQIMCELQKIVNLFHGKDEYEVESYNRSIIEDLDDNDGYGLSFIFKKYGLYHQEFDIRKGWIKFEISSLFELDNFKREKSKFLSTINKLNSNLPEYKMSSSKNVGGIIRIIDDIGFSIEHNTMIVKFNNELPSVYRVFGKMNQFTRIGLRDMSKLKSHYSIRLFVLICEMKTTGIIKISTKSMYIIFGIDHTSKRGLGALQNAVLKGIREIDEKLGIKIKHDWSGGNLILTFKPFEYKINKKSIQDAFSEDEIRIYGGCDE